MIDNQQILHHVVFMNFWEEIRQKAPIEDVISEYIQVKQSGANFTCLCPFHKEKSPSFMISPEKQIFHCFGCGAGGDVFEFVSQIEGVSKIEVAKKLAKKYGIIIPDNRNEWKTSQEKIENQDYLNELNSGYKLLEWVAELYHQVLLKILQDRQSPITQYCLKRGLDLETIKKFKLGYAPKDNFILKFAQKNKLNTSLLQAIGILKINALNSLKDKFSDRLMIPIFDLDGRVVGFTARVLPYDKTDRPKYLNSPASKWFDKSHLWFGLNFHKKQIIQEHKAIIVEGNMDVIAASQKGLDYAVASQGTSFTHDQLKILKKVTRNIDLAFDNDTAGVLAGKKFFQEAVSMGFTVKKLYIPQEYKDLDEYLNSQDFIGSYETKNYLDYLFDYHYLDLSSSDSTKQKQVALELLQILGCVDEFTREQYIVKLSTITNLSQTTLRKFIQTRGETEQTHTSNDNRKSLDLQTVYYNDFQKVVAFIVFFPDYTMLITESGAQELFQLTKAIISDLQSYNDLGEYISEKAAEIEFIWKAGAFNKDISQLNMFLMSIDRILSSKINFLLANSDMNEIYLNYKKGLKL